MLEMFPNCVPVGVGHRGHEALHSLAIPHYWLRHPAHGGRQAFTRGVDELSSRLSRPHEHDKCVRLGEKPAVRVDAMAS